MIVIISCLLWVDGTFALKQEAVGAMINSFATNVKSQVRLRISLERTHHEKTHTEFKRTEAEALPLYLEGDALAGRIELQLRGTNQYEHTGLKCYLIGKLEIYSDSNLSTQFTTVSKELEPAGYLTSDKHYPFKFTHFDKDYETFKGKTGRVRYLIRAVLNRNVLGQLIEEKEFAVHQSGLRGQTQVTPMTMELFEERRLQVEIQLTKNAYHTKQFIEGTLTFMSLNVTIGSIELHIIRKETLGTLQTSNTTTKTLCKYEIMDGNPAPNESIPFRMGLAGVKHLTPTYDNIHNRFFVRHWVGVRVTTQKGFKYNKQAELTIFRK